MLDISTKALDRFLEMARVQLDTKRTTKGSHDRHFPSSVAATATARAKARRAAQGNTQNRQAGWLKRDIPF